MVGSSESVDGVLVSCTGLPELFLLEGCTAQERNRPVRKRGEQLETWALDVRDIAEIERKCPPGGKHPLAVLAQFVNPRASKVAFEPQNRRVVGAFGK